MPAPPDNDIDRIMDVMARAFEPRWGEAWTRRQVEDSLLLSNTHYYLRTVQFRDSPPGAGFAMVRAAPGEEEVLLLAVTPEHRRRGLARQVLRDVVAAARERRAQSLFLEMRANNPAAAFYTSAGFTAIGRRKGYYTVNDGERLDAITFGLSI